MCVAHPQPATHTDAQRDRYVKMMSALSTVLSAGQILQLYNAYSKAKSEVKKFLKWLVLQIWLLLVLFCKSLIRPCQFVYVIRRQTIVLVSLSLTRSLHTGYIRANIDNICDINCTHAHFLSRRSLSTNRAELLGVFIPVVSGVSSPADVFTP